MRGALVGKWDIQPTEVRAVLAHTQGIAGEFRSDVVAMESSMRGAATESSSALIMASLQGFARACGQDTRFVFERTGAGLAGASQAVDAYLHGDHEMVLNAQSLAAQVPNSGTRMPGDPQ